MTCYVSDGKVIPIAAFRRSAGRCVTVTEQPVKAFVYHEGGKYIVAFGQPPYLWRKHDSLEEIRQTYFYFDWSEPENEQDIGRTVMLVGKL